MEHRRDSAVRGHDFFLGRSSSRQVIVGSDRASILLYLFCLTIKIKKDRIKDVEKERIEVRIKIAYPLECLTCKGCGGLVYRRSGEWWLTISLFDGKQDIERA